MVRKWPCETQKNISGWVNNSSVIKSLGLVRWIRSIIECGRRMLTVNIERFLRKEGEIPQTEEHTETLEDKWAAREWKKSRCFLALFLMAVKHYWCHYWALLWLLLILPPAWGKKPLVVQSSLFALERQFEAISNSFPNLPRGFAGLPLQLLFLWETEKRQKSGKALLLSGKFIVILRMRIF